MISKELNEKIDGIWTAPDNDDSIINEEREQAAMG